MDGIRLRWFQDLRSRWQRDLVARLIAEGDRAKQCCDWDIATASYRKAIDRYRRVFRRDGGWLTARNGAEVLLNLGHSLRERGDITDANHAFRQALALDQSFVQEHLGKDFVLEPINQNDLLGIYQSHNVNASSENDRNPGQDDQQGIVGELRLAPLPEYWPYRADPPQRYWGKYRRYQEQGGLIRLEEDIPGFTAGGDNDGDISRFYFFCLAFDQLMKEGIKGDLAELGVYRGNTASVIATMARRMGTTAWLLDTFEGFNSSDLNGVDSNQRMQFTDTSLEAARALVGDRNVRYVKGYFPKSTGQMPDKLRFSLVHIDCDLYSPMRHALKYFYDRLLPGGYLIIHDYASLAWCGAEKAVDEFFADKPEPVIALTDGCGSAVIRKARPPGKQFNWLMQQRCSLLSTEWKSAGRDTFADILGAGWDSPQDWGVWGVGASHVLELYVDPPPLASIRIELDCAAALVGSRVLQSVDVHAGGRMLTQWGFSRERNRGVREVIVPLGAVSTGPWGVLMVRLEFRPHSVVPIVELDPIHNEGRALGLALFALRRGDVPE